MDIFGRKRIHELKQEVDSLQYKLEVTNHKYHTLNATLKNIEALTLAVGRVIQFKEKYFAMPEDDPSRKAESDALGQKVIDRLKQEHAIRQRMVP